MPIIVTHHFLLYLFHLLAPPTLRVRTSWGQSKWKEIKESEFSFSSPLFHSMATRRFQRCPSGPCGHYCGKGLETKKFHSGPTLRVRVNAWARIISLWDRTNYGPAHKEIKIRNQMLVHIVRSYALWRLAAALGLGRKCLKGKRNKRQG